MSTFELFGRSFVLTRPAVRCRPAGVVVVLIAGGVLTAGCDTKNIGTGPPLSSGSVSFTMDPDPAIEGEPVTFVATVTGTSSTVMIYDWNFGEMGVETGSASTVSHTYAAAGTYTATLTATLDTGNALTSTAVITVEAGAGVSCADYWAYFDGLPCADETLSAEASCHEDLSDFCTGVEAYYACWMENTYCDDEGELVRDTDQCAPLLVCQ